MKFTIPLHQYRKSVILCLVGIACTIFSYVTYMFNPAKLILESKLTMAPDSLAFRLWKDPPIDIYVKVFIFNITNPEQFLRGEEKLKVEEIGPYVYKEILHNENITWYEENKTISYIPRRTIIYVPEMSIGDPNMDIVQVPNVPMLGISSALHDAGFFVNYPWSSLVNMLDSKPILNITAHEYLWGYEDRLVRLASGIVPNFIDFRKFGLLDRMYNEGENLVHMNIGKNKNMSEEIGRYLSIELYNGSPGMSQWGYREVDGNETYPENTICNRIRGATEGELFPTFIDRHASFRIYRKAFCRTLPIVYKSDVLTESGLNGFLYVMPDDFLETPDKNPDNACYCKKKGKCLKKGLSDMTPCYYSIPAAMSLPHFLDADPTLLEDVEGLNPDPEKHATTIILEPTAGVPIHVHFKLQINLVMEHTTYNSKIKPFNDMTVPVFWMDLVIPELSPEVDFLLKLVLVALPITQTIVISLLAIVGVAMLVFSIVSMFWAMNQRQEPLSSERRDSCDLRIPLNYGQYSTIHILPAVKNTTSKTDLFN